MKTKKILCLYYYGIVSSIILLSVLIINVLYTLHNNGLHKSLFNLFEVLVPILIGIICFVLNVKYIHTLIILVIPQVLIPLLYYYEIFFSDYVEIVFSLLSVLLVIVLGSISYFLKYFISKIKNG